MNLNSKYFDRIRIRPDAQGAAKEPETLGCEWDGCERAGDFRAPKGRYREGQYHHFCIDHVRAYNKSYNYFAGMPDNDVAAYQKSAATGHRPTWSVDGKKGHRDGGFSWTGTFADQYGFFGDAPTAASNKAQMRRPLRNHERKSFAALDLEGHEPPEEIKARYKGLVKQLHPDANGGDRSFEDRLREIIHAYHYLRSAGFC
ncbi:MAG: J domain-containing protein [Alphaproteobacteria bacterium]